MRILEPRNLAAAIAEAYRWQRRLGGEHVVAPGCHIVSASAFPEVWDLNHADEVTARTDAEISDVYAAMNHFLAHTRWRVFHTDGSTPEAFVARLALDGFEERPATIQMALGERLTDRGAPVALRAVETDEDWRALHALVRANHVEGNGVADLGLTPQFTASLVAGYRAKSPHYQFYLTIRDGEPAAYGAIAAAPNGVGMIEDLFTLPSARRRGVATGMIARFADRLRARDCHTVFLGALANDTPKLLYARLGFRPVALARVWVREGPCI